MAKARWSPFVHRQRASARVALYGSLLLVAAAAALLVRLTPRGREVDLTAATSWHGIDYAALPEVDLLRRLVAIDTSYPDGDELGAARLLAEQLAAAGLEPHVEYLGERRANLWAILEGEDPQAIVLHNHLDVDPVGNLEEWAHPPFAGEIDGPWIFGRGIFDMKSVTVAQLLAIRDLARRGKPERSVIFLATTGEEGGSDLGTRWILRQHPRLAARFAAVLTEGGVVEAAAPDQAQYWGIEFAQKQFADLELCAARREPLDELRRELREEGKPAAGLKLTPEVRTFLSYNAPTRRAQYLRRLLADPDRLLRDPLSFSRLAPPLQSLFRSELVPFPVVEDAGGGYRLAVKFHLLPGASFSEVREELFPAWRNPGVAVTLHEPLGAAHGSSIDHFVFRGLVEAVDDLYPGSPAGPYFLAWTATDARFFRAAGIPAYGFSPFLIVVADTLHIGGPNERMAVPGFLEGLALYRHALQKLAGRHSPP